MCNRPKLGSTSGWASGERTVKFPGRQFGSLALSYSPVSAIGSVKVYTSSTSSETLDSAYYRLNYNLESVYIESTTRFGYSGYGGGVPGLFADIEPLGQLDRVAAYPYTEVVYTGGFANQDAVPEDLVFAANSVAGWMYFVRTSDPSKQSESLGNYSYVSKIIGKGLTLNEYALDLVSAHIRYAGGQHE